MAGQQLEARLGGRLILSDPRQTRNVLSSQRIFDFSHFILPHLAYHLINRSHLNGLLHVFLPPKI